MELRHFQLLEFLSNKISNIEKSISRIEEKVDFSIALQRNHLIRVKNGEFIDDSMILMGSPYNDLTPEQAFTTISNPNLDFMLLDVSKPENRTDQLEGSVFIPLEALAKRFHEISSKTLPILVISELGLRSIQACEFLISKGYFNVNNISGGYKFYPGITETQDDEDESLPPELAVS